MIVWIDTGAPVCSCCGSVDSEVRYTLSGSDTALLDYLTQARYASNAAPLIDGTASAAIGNAATVLIADVDAHAQGGTAKGQRARQVLQSLVSLAGTYPTATWHAA